MASFQPTSPEGSSISAKTTSTMPSRMAALLATWWYSDMASTPSSVASLRMLSDPTPSRSARATAASRTRCLVSGIRGAGLGSVWVAISVLTVEANPWRQERVDDTVCLTTYTVWVSYSVSHRHTGGTRRIDGSSGLVRL